MICNVEHLMKSLSEIVVVRSTDTIRNLRDKFKKKPSEDAALVIDNNRLYGVITFLDIALAGDENKVEKWMTKHTPEKPLVTADASDPVEKIKHLMEKHHVHQLPVVDSEDKFQARGLVTLRAAVMGCSSRSRRGKNGQPKTE